MQLPVPNSYQHGRLAKHYYSGICKCVLNWRMNRWAKARWSILLPVVAVVVTTLLLVSAGRRWPLDYMPYGITAAWALNGPAFFPTPFWFAIRRAFC